MKVTIKVDDTAVRGMFRDLPKQVAFATSKALNVTAGKVREALPGALDAALDRPTAFTKSQSGTFVVPAKRDNLAAEVRFKERQASYLRYQVFGGERSPTRRALRLPAAIKLDSYGNLPRGIIQQLIAVARKETGLKRRKARRIRVSNKLELFYGDPTDVGGRDMPPGIYKIVPRGGSGSALVPLIVFPAQSATYRKRVDLEAISAPVVASAFEPAFVQALRIALETAR